MNNKDLQRRERLLESFSDMGKDGKTAEKCPERPLTRQGRYISIPIDFVG